MNERRITLVTFGFKYGPPNTNHYFDVSFVKNPARDERWSLFSEPDDAMRSFVLSQPSAQAFVERVVPLIKTLSACDDDARIGFGCNSGRHRSCILAAEVASRLEAEGYPVRMVHREEVYR